MNDTPMAFVPTSRWSMGGGFCLDQPSEFFDGAHLERNDNGESSF
jgi:hypothetical protein